MTEPSNPTVIDVMWGVMKQVTSIAKRDFNDLHRFNFRGIDTVLDSVGPAFRAHGVVTKPKLKSISTEVVKSSKDKPMRLTTVVVRYKFTGPAGDSVTAVVPGEAWDSEDKGSSKAMSVAFRTALLQVLAIPTGERDPHAGAPVPAKLARLREEVKKLGADKGWSFEQIRDEYAAWCQGAHDIADAGEEDLEAFNKTLRPARTMQRKPQAGTS